MLGWSFLFACAAAPSGVPGAGHSADTDPPPDTGEPPAPRDDDGDGHASVETGGDDCDDGDPAIHPGADESWNAADDDCDGRVDGDGAFAGILAVGATAVFKGEAFSFSLDCPATLYRDGRSVDLEGTCAPDPDDAYAMLLLGADLWVRADPSDVDGPAWEGLAEVASSNGWDTRAPASLLWDGFDEVAVAVAIDAPSLDLAATGVLARMR